MVCRGCKVKVAQWFAHEPQDCCDVGCDCEAECEECMRYHLHLLEWIRFSMN